MRTAPIAAFCCLLAATACHRSGGGAPPGPPRLEPLAGTGQVAIEMNGTWEIKSSTPSVPGRMDSGASQTLQFALGSVEADTIAGLVQHSTAIAFPPRDRPIAGLYRVALRRVP